MFTQTTTFGELGVLVWPQFNSYLYTIFYNLNVEEDFGKMVKGGIEVIGSEEMKQRSQLF